MKFRKLWIFVLCISLNFSCSKKLTTEIVISPQEAFSKAMDLFQAKKYRQAINAFQNVVLNFPGSVFAGDAQYYLAESYFQSKDYQSAITEYEFFINSFVGSQYLEDAYYKLAWSYYKTAPSIHRDPSILDKVMEILETLEDRFPQTKYKNEITQMRREINSRWAEKHFRIGELYYKGGEYEAARIYFDYLGETYPQSKWADLGKYYIGQIMEKTDSISKAIEIYQSLLNQVQDQEIIRLAQRRLQILEKK